jgi:TrmH family RNA methyltransferase
MLSKGQISRLRALQGRRGRDDAGEFLVEGIRLAEDLLASPIVPRLAVISPSLEDSGRGRALADRLRAATTTLEASDADLGRIGTTETHQGVILAAATPTARLSELDLGAATLLIVLDAIQDPGNFGTIVRCADAFGASAVIALPGTADPWNPKSVRSAAGASFRVPVIMATFTDVRDAVRSAGGVVLGAAMDGTDVGELSELARPTALVLGNEGAGLSDDVRAACDALVAVPIRSAESLNVGVAAGILMYALMRSA